MSPPNTANPVAPDPTINRAARRMVPPIGSAKKHSKPRPSCPHFTRQHQFRRSDARLAFSDERFFALPFYPASADDHTVPAQRRATCGLFIWAAIGLGWRSNLVFVPGADAHSAASPATPGCTPPSPDVECQLAAVAGELADRNAVLVRDGNLQGPGSLAAAACLGALPTEVLDGRPACPSEMNPIEHAWDVLKGLIALRRPRNMRQLRVAASAAWAAIPQETLDRFVRTFLGALCQGTAQG